MPNLSTTTQVTCNKKRYESHGMKHDLMLSDSRVFYEGPEAAFRCFEIMIHVILSSFPKLVLLD